MITKHIVPIAALLGIMLNSCSHKQPTEPNGEFIYPMKVGHQWQYTHESAILNFRPDSGNGVPKDTLRYTRSNTIVEIVRTAKLRQSIDTYVFRETLTANGQTTMSEIHFNNKADGMYSYAYTGPSLTTPRKSTIRQEISFNGKRFASVYEPLALVGKGLSFHPNYSDSLILEDPPLKSLLYPLQIGKQWNYRVPGNPFRIDKRVVAQENIKVAAGTFTCFKMQWLYDFGDDGGFEENLTFFDFIAREGLVRRFILFKDAVLSAGVNPERIGLVDVKDEVQLTEVNLK